MLANTGLAQTVNKPIDGKVPDGMEVATFGGGCFCVFEAVFENVNGVVDVVSGYSGGTIPNPTYQTGLHQEDWPYRSLSDHL